MSRARGFSDYLKALMTDVTITNRELLGASLALREAKATNALASVKLAKLRKAVEADAAIVREAVVELMQRHATKDDAGVAIQQRTPAGVPLFLLMTGTPAYELATDPAAAVDAELTPLLAATVTLSIAPLTETDLAAIALADDYGAALIPFVTVE